MSRLDCRGLLLFVPGHHPERFARAATSGADGVIVDLEDSVAAKDKDHAREEMQRAIGELSGGHVPFFVRINAVRTTWHEADVAAVCRLPIAGVIVSKAERPADLQTIARLIGGSGRVIALIETALGLAAARSLAEAAARIAFGSIDYAADIRTAHTREALLSARSELVLASRLAGLPPPIDGVTSSIDSAELVQADARYAASLGFSGKLLIHPNQVAPAARGFRPTDDEIAWASRIAAMSPDEGVTIIEGAMIDAPVRARALHILRRAGI